MNITIYGFCAALAVLTLCSILPYLSINLLWIAIGSIVISSLLCKTCANTYTLASVLAIFPLLTLVFIKDCQYIQYILIASCIGIAIGRVGCFFAGCCSGKMCGKKNLFGISYKKGTIVVDKYCKKEVTVYPTILIEIFINLLIAYIVWVSKYGAVYFGILQSIFMIMTDKWRMVSRMNLSYSILPILSLLLFSFLVYNKCKGITAKPKINLSFKPSSIIYSLLVALVLSNDINFSNLNKKLNLF